jgi:hypothetical protein
MHKRQVKLLVGLVLIALVACLFPGEPLAQGSERLWTSVRTDPVTRLVSKDSTTFRITGADSDTSNWYVPWKWTGVIGVVHSSGNSPNLQAQAWCGNKIGSNYVAVKCDSLAITASGDFVWQLNMPLTTRVQVIFSAPTTANGTTTIDSLRLNRNW